MGKASELLRKYPSVRAWGRRRYGSGISDEELIGRLTADAASGRLGAKMFESCAAKNNTATKPKPKPEPKGNRKPMTTPKTPVKKAAPSVAQKRFSRLDPVAPGDRLSSKRSPVITKAGTPLIYDGRQVDRPSDRQKAVIGAYGRLLALKLGIKSRPMSGYERALLAESAEKDAWVGDVGSNYYDREHPAPAAVVKAVLDDSVSGGIEITPYYFDEAILTFPLLHGQLAPYVNMVDVPRGRRIKGGTIANPTMSWGAAEGTAITPFNTSALVGPLDTVIYPLTGAIEVGLDMEEDSPVNVGETLIQLFGARTANELDKVIATGDGVTQPQGIFNTTGTSIVNSANGIPGPLTVGDLELMIQAMPPQYRIDPTMNIRWLLQDTTYNRFCSIPVGPGDERRVFGTNNHGDYQLMNYPVSVGTSWPISQGALVAFAKYRMYRRLGLETRVVTEGRSLALSNTKLIVCRARFGGRVVDGAAISLCNDLAGG